MSLPLQKQSIEGVKKWVQAFQGAFDAFSTDSFQEFYIPNSRVIFGNNETLVGLENIIAFFNGIFPLISFMQHHLKNVDIINDTIYFTGSMTFIVAGDAEKKEIYVPAAAVYHILSEEEAMGKGSCVLKEAEIYADLGPLFGRVGEVQKKEDEE